MLAITGDFLTSDEVIPIISLVVFFLFSLPLLLFKFFIFYTFDDNPKSYQDGSEIHSDKIILSSF